MTHKRITAFFLALALMAGGLSVDSLPAGATGGIDYTPGDLNEDGYINTTDVVLLRRYIADGYDVTVREDAGDVNTDGYLNTTDVVAIRRYIADGYGVTLKPALTMHFTQEDVCASPSLSGYADFSSHASETFTVPGLNQSIVPQGMDYWAEKNRMLISGYCSDAAQANGKGSVLLAVDMATGKLAAEYYLKNADGTYYTGHAGGIAVSNKNVFISDGATLHRIPLSALTAAGKSGEVTFVEEISVPVRASFCNVSGGILWVGDFYYGTSYPTDEYRHMTNREGKPYYAWAVGYELDGETENELCASAMVVGSYATPDRILSITDRIQGMTFLEQADCIVLSQSYGRKNNSTLYFYENPMSGVPHTEVILNGKSVPLWFLDGKLNCSTMLTLPMSEGITAISGRLHVLFESGAEKYRLDGGKLPTDRVYEMDVDGYFE